MVSGKTNMYGAWIKIRMICVWFFCQSYSSSALIFVLMGSESRFHRALCQFRDISIFAWSSWVCVSFEIKFVGFIGYLFFAYCATNARQSLRPGHTALYGLITAKNRQKVVSREADDVVRVDVEFKTSYSRFIDVAGRGEKSERRRTQQKVLNCSKF